MRSRSEEQFLTLLARKRTELARDRTALAMIRTSLALILAGIAFIGFGDKAVWFYPAGMVSITLGLLFVIVTFRHFVRYSRELKNLIAK